jgi:hypothetical protein
MVTQINLHFVKLSFPLPTYEKKGKLLLIIVKKYKRLTYKIVKNIRTKLRYRKKNPQKAKINKPWTHRKLINNEIKKKRRRRRRRREKKYKVEKKKTFKAAGPPS